MAKMKPRCLVRVPGTRCVNFCATKEGSWEASTGGGVDGIRRKTMYLGTVAYWHGRLSHGIVATDFAGRPSSVTASPLLINDARRLIRIRPSIDHGLVWFNTTDISAFSGPGLFLLVQVRPGDL
jgi:hypothetical protein